MMRKSLVFALMLVAAAVVANAQTPASDQPMTSLTVQGTVVASTPSSLDIEKPGGNRIAFSLAPGVSLPQDLVVGNSVSVTYNELASGQFQATRISRVSQVAESSEPYGTPASSPAADDDQMATTTAAQDDPADTEALPRTASSTPLLALLGFTLLVAALALRSYVGRAPQR